VEAHVTRNAEEICARSDGAVQPREAADGAHEGVLQQIRRGAGERGLPAKIAEQRGRGVAVKLIELGEGVVHRLKRGRAKGRGSWFLSLTSGKAAQKFTPREHQKLPEPLRQRLKKLS